MTLKLSLLEHFSEPVDDVRFSAVLGGPTGMTFTDDERYDRDQFGGMGLPSRSLELLDQTYITKSDQETSDDSPGVGLGIARSLLEGTEKASNDRDTYDEQLAVGLDSPRVLTDSTDNTRSDADTYDKDPAGGLGVSQSMQ